METYTQTQAAHTGLTPQAPSLRLQAAYPELHTPIPRPSACGRPQAPADPGRGVLRKSVWPPTRARRSG